MTATFAGAGDLPHSSAKCGSLNTGTTDLVMEIVSALLKRLFLKGDVRLETTTKQTKQTKQAEMYVH